MDLVIAIGHILGAFFAISLLGIGIFLIANWEKDRNLKLLNEEASLALGISIHELDNNPEHIPKVIQFVSTRFSNELLRNRLSDLCGLIRSIWGWLCLILQAGIFIAVIWYTFTDDLGIAVYAWVIIPLELLFWVISIGFSLLCKLLTGRYPGQAKQARKSLVNFIRDEDAKQINANC